MPDTEVTKEEKAEQPTQAAPSVPHAESESPKISESLLNQADSTLDKVNQVILGKKNTSILSSGIGTVINVYAKEEVNSKYRVDAVKIDSWIRKKETYEHLLSGLAHELDITQNLLRKDRLIITEYRLPQLAEDLFELVCKSDWIRGPRLAATCTEANDEFSLGALIAALKNIQAGSLLFLNIHSLVKDAQAPLRGQLDDNLDKLAHILCERDAYCVVASPPFSPREDRRIRALTYNEEEAILVGRASIRGGQIQPIIVAAINEQIARNLWGEPPERLRHLDDLIRSGTIESKVDEYAQVDQASAERAFTAWLQFLIGFGDLPEGRNQMRLRRGWSEEVTAGLVDHALFVLTSFRDLGPSDFHFLMRALLSGKRVIEHVQETEWVTVDEPSATTEKVKTVTQVLRERARSVERQVNLQDVYSAKPDNLLALLDVRVRGDEGRLDFEPAFKLQLARQLFRSQRGILADTLFLAESVEKSILFDAPLHVAEQLADRYVEYTSRLLPDRQKEFISNWMDRSARHFIEERLPNFEIPVGDDTPELKLLLEAFGKHVSREYARDLSSAFAERASLLLARLLPEQSTRKLVDHALDRLMVEGRDAEGKHDLLLMFIRILRRNNDFDALQWLKRLLAEGDDDAKQRALNLLATRIEKGADGERSTLFEALLSWMPTGKHAYVLNNQTAALLAPRVALHRAFARRSEREHGKVKQLQPLFDLEKENGLAPEFNAAVRLLTAPIDGPWILIDLNLVDQLIAARWGVDTEAMEDDSPFPALFALGSCSSVLYELDTDARQTSFVALLVEALALLLGNPADAEPQPLEKVRKAVERIASLLTQDALYVTYRRAYDVSKSLSEQESVEAEKRATCALWLGDTLYRLHAAANKAS